MFTCFNDGVTTINPRQQKTRNESRCSLRHGIYVWRPAGKHAYNPEFLGTRGRICEGLLVPLLLSMAELLQGSTWAGWVLRCIPWSRRYYRTTMQFSKKIVTPSTRLELFSHALKIMKVNFSIFPGQQSHQIWTLWNHCGQFWRLNWGIDSHLQHLQSNLKPVFKKNGIKIPLETVQNMHGYCRAEGKG
jgi:hypothetical protein